MVIGTTVTGAMTKMDPQSLDGRTAMVTGASRGIGLAIALGLVKHGAHVVMAGRQIETLELARRNLEEQGVSQESCSLLSLDLSRGDDIDRVTAELGDRDIDILVNNAGVMLPAESFLDRDWSAWERILQINFTGPARLCHAFGSQMVARNWGRIINIASIAGLAGPQGNVEYGTSKAALIGFTRNLAVELAASGVTVNAVAPGKVETLSVGQRRGTLEYQERLRSVPTGRFVMPEEVVDVVMFLASPMASQITGQTMVVDGGEIAAGPYAARLTDSDE